MVDRESWVAPTTSGSRLILLEVLCCMSLVYHVLGTNQACTKNLVRLFVMSSQSSEPEMLLSVAKVAKLTNVSEWGVRQAIKRKRLRSEPVLIDNKMRVAVPLSAMVEYWNLPASKVHLIESDARQHAREAPVQLVKRLSASVSGAVGGDP